MPKHVLVIDDDALLRRSLAFNLEQAGYRASSAANAEDALARAGLDPPDLALLDIGLPGMDGLDAVAQFKKMNIPVIFVTARRRELDEVLGLELGADDYITKPFDLDVLLAHIKAVLRRIGAAAPPEQPGALQVGTLVIDPRAHSVQLRGEPVELSPREFDLLYALAQHPHSVLSIDEILGRVWGAEFLGQPQVVYVHIRWLREKIERDPNKPRILQTVRGVGYRLAPPED